MADTEIKPIESLNIFKLKYVDVTLKINNLSRDELKEICRENNITGFSTSNKQDMINKIFTDYSTHRTILYKINYPPSKICTSV